MDKMVGRSSSYCTELVPRIFKIFTNVKRNVNAQKNDDLYLMIH